MSLPLRQERKRHGFIFIYIYIYAHTCVAIALRRRNVGFLEIVALGFSAMGRNKMRAAWSKAGSVGVPEVVSSSSKKIK